MIKPGLVGGVAGFAAILFSFGIPARATAFFDHPFCLLAGKVFRCDPFSSGNTAVWDSFTAANRRALTSLQRIGLRPDAMPFGVDLEIAGTPECRRGCRTVLPDPHSRRSPISVPDKELPSKTFPTQGGPLQ